MALLSLRKCSLPNPKELHCTALLHYSLSDFFVRLGLGLCQVHGSLPLVAARRQNFPGPGVVSNGLAAPVTVPSLIYIPFAIRIVLWPAWGYEMCQK